MEIQIGSRIYTARIEKDLHQMIPWKEWDCHGIVIENPCRSKKPGEMILYCANGCKIYYDFAETVKIARTRWGAKSGKEAAQLAMSDYNRLRQWYDNVWCFVILVVEDEDGESECIGGIESDDAEGIKDIANQLARELYEREFGPQPDLFGG